MSTQKVTCPSLNPRCDGELVLSERHLVESIRKHGPIPSKPKSAICTKCGKKWTDGHLRTEGIDINQVRLA